MTRHRLRPSVLTSALALTTLIAAPASARAPEEVDDFATIESRAYAQEEAGEHREAAFLWTELAQRDDASPRARQQAVYEAQGAYRLAYDGSRDPALLCAGWSLVDGYLRDHAAEFSDAPDRRAEFRGYADGLRIQLEEHQVSRGDVPCTEVLSSSNPQETAYPTAQAEPAPTATPLRSVPSRDPAPISAPSESAPRPGRGLVISGSVALVVSAALLGVMGYGVHGVVTRRDAILTIGDQARAEDRLLTTTERDQLEELYRSGSSFQTLAIATGVAGGIALVGGTTLVILGKRRGQEGRVAVAPSASPTHAGLVFTGFF